MGMERMVASDHSIGNVAHESNVQTVSVLDVFP